MPVLLLWSCDSAIEWAILTEQSDIDRAIALNGKQLNRADEGTGPVYQALEWLDSIGLEGFRGRGITELPAMPDGLRIVTVFGY